MSRHNSDGRVAVRIANPSGARIPMATKKKRRTKKRKSNPTTKKRARRTRPVAAAASTTRRRRRRNPSVAAKGHAKRKSARRRRRNPGESTAGAVLKALVAGTAVGVGLMLVGAYAPNRWIAPGAAALATAGGVAAVAKGHPSLGLGVIVGATSGLAVPWAASKILSMAAGSRETAPVNGGELSGYAPAYPGLGAYAPAYPSLGTVLSDDMGTVLSDDMGTVLSDDMGAYAPAYRGMGGFRSWA